MGTDEHVTLETSERTCKILQNAVQITFRSTPERQIGESYQNVANYNVNGIHLRMSHGCQRVHPPNLAYNIRKK